MNLQTRNKLWIVLIVIFCASLAYSFYYRIPTAVDARAYDNIGWNLAQGIGYLEHPDYYFNTPALDDGIGRIGPGYEFFLAGIYKIFGHKIWLVWIIHGLLRFLTAFIIYKLCLFLFEDYGYREQVGLLAAFLFGFSPDLIILNSMLLTETFFLFLLAWTSYILLKTLDSPNIKSVLYSSFLLGVSFMARPTIVFYLIAGAIIFFYRNKISYAFLLFLFPIIIVAPWAVRNWNIYHRVILTSSTGGYDLWVGNNASATGGFDKTNEIASFRRSNGIIASDEKGWSEYFSFIRAHPIKFIDLQLEKAGIYFSMLRPTGFWDHLGKFEKVFTLGASFLWTSILFGFGIAGVFLLGDETKNIFRKRIFILFAILQPLAVIPVIVETRYRAPFFIFLAISVAYVLTKFYYDKENKQKLKYIAAMSFLFLFLIIIWDLAGNFGEVISRFKNLI